jgi:tetratricopeptide (TPR) repeat protein
VQYASIKGFALLDLGRFGEAWDSFQQEVADDAHPFGRAQRDLGIAAYLMELMAYERAEQAARAVIEQAHSLSRPWMVLWAQTVLGASLVAAGKLRGKAVDIVRSEIEAAGAFPAGEVLVEALLAGGAAADALLEAEKLVGGSDAGGRVRQYVPALELEARALIELGRSTEALPLLDEALERARDMDYRRILWRIERTRGDALSALGDPKAASGSYHEAAAELRALADTIPDAELQTGFLSSPVVVSTLKAAQSEGREGGQG